MTVESRINVKTSSLLELNSSNPRKSVQEALTLLNGALSGTGGASGASAVITATTSGIGSDNDPGTPFVGGVVSISQDLMESSNPNLLIQVGAAANQVPLQDPTGYTDALVYANQAISDLNDANLIQFDRTTSDKLWVVTRWGAAVKLGEMLYNIDAGSILTVCGVPFTALNSTQYNALAGSKYSYFNFEADENSVGNFCSVVGRHPLLAGRIVASLFATSAAPSSPGIMFGWIGLNAPSIPFTFSLRNAPSIDCTYISERWYNGAVELDPAMGTFIVFSSSTNAAGTYGDPTFGFGFVDQFGSNAQPDTGEFYQLPTMGDSEPPSFQLEFKGMQPFPYPPYQTDPKYYFAIMLGEKSPPATSSAVFPTQTSNAVTGKITPDARTTLQNISTLIQSCLSGTDGSSNYDYITITTYLNGSSTSSVTWFVGT